MFAMKSPQPTLECALIRNQPPWHRKFFEHESSYTVKWLVDLMHCTYTARATGTNMPSFHNAGAMFIPPLSSGFSDSSLLSPQLKDIRLQDSDPRDSSNKQDVDNMATFKQELEQWPLHFR